MIKQNRKMIAFTSIVTLLPILIGLILWKQLPDSLATHFGINSKPNGYSAKAFVVFGLPFIILLIHLICVIATKLDPKSKDINRKIFNVVLWICQLISLVVCNTIYVYNLGYEIDIEFFCSLLIGVLYLILGNFIPKVKPNYSIGFRISWALCDSENWYHTHRFGGKCMVAGGIAMIVTSPFQNVWQLLILCLLPCILPVIYSYMYYRKTIS